MLVFFYSKLILKSIEDCIWSLQVSKKNKDYKVVTVSFKPHRKWSPGVSLWDFQFFLCASPPTLGASRPRFDVIKYHRVLGKTGAKNTNVPFFTFSNRLRVLGNATFAGYLTLKQQYFKIQGDIGELWYTIVQYNESYGFLFLNMCFWYYCVIVEHAYISTNIYIYSIL